MRKFIFFFVISVTFLFLISSCATLFKGTTEEVNFSSNPIGTEVWVDGNKMGETPVSFDLESKKTYVIQFKKEGFETTTVNLTNHIGAGWVILDVVAGLIPVIVDAATGAWYSFDEKNVNVSLREIRENGNKLPYSLTQMYR